MAAVRHESGWLLVSTANEDPIFFVKLGAENRGEDSDQMNSLASELSTLSATIGLLRGCPEDVLGRIEPLVAQDGFAAAVSHFSRRRTGRRDVPRTFGNVVRLSIASPPEKRGNGGGRLRPENSFGDMALLGS